MLLLTFKWKTCFVTLTRLSFSWQCPHQGLFRNHYDLLSSQCPDTKLTIKIDYWLGLNLLKRDFVLLKFPCCKYSENIVVIFSCDCTFTTHVNSVTCKANASLQILSKICRCGCNAHSVLQAYLCYVCPMLGYACPVWDPSVLRIAYMQKLVSVQKRATRIILSKRDISYHKCPCNLWTPKFGTLFGWPCTEIWQNAFV